MASAPRKQNYRFTFGPWNISTGEDPFGPAARKEVPFAAKIRECKKLGFDGVQLHDDDAVEADLDPQATERGAGKTCHACFVQHCFRQLFRCPSRLLHVGESIERAMRQPAAEALDVIESSNKLISPRVELLTHVVH